MVTLWSPEAVVSHRAAIHLYEIDRNPNESFPWVEATIPVGQSARLANVTLHRTNLISPVRVIEGLDVTNPARTVIDVANLVHPKKLERFLENALFDHTLTFRQIRAEIALIGKRGRRGVGIMRALLELYDPEDEKGATRLERELRREFVRLGMRPPEEQFEVWADGRQRFIDFAYPKLKIGIEAHSVGWHTRLTDFEKDADRDASLTDSGWTMYYVTKRTMEDRLLKIKHRLPATFVQKPAA